VSTRNDIHSLLLREQHTVAQLCEKLGVTRNAINVQLRQLESEGLVRRTHRRPTGALGKPAVVYEAAPGSEDLTSSAYQTFLSSLLAVLKDSLPAGMLQAILESCGRHLARQANLDDPKDVGEGLRSAMRAADALGAKTDIALQKDGVMVRNFNCPIGSVVRQEPGACRAMAAFFSEATGRPTTVCCQRGERLICQYLVKLKNPVALFPDHAPSQPT
jgi:predicted ArsR family transcriptional regulator